MKIKEIPATREATHLIAGLIYKVLYGDTPETNILADMLGTKPNPLKGKCYEATCTMYKIFGSKIVELWRCPDVYGDFHWFCTNKWGDLIDITAEQYTIEGHKSPAENKNEWSKQYPLSFMSMRKRVDKVYGKIVLELDKIKNLDELK